MRTPNAACIVCSTPLYRRPSDLARVRHVACIAHRALAQSLSGLTDAQREGLSLGRLKGTNHRAGYRHTAGSKAKMAATNAAFWAANPDRLAERSAKTRGEAHYRWNGGSGRLNASIRRMTESRRWCDAVKARDSACVRCGSLDRLEAHHCPPLADLLERLGRQVHGGGARHLEEACTA